MRTYDPEAVRKHIKAFEIYSELCAAKFYGEKYYTLPLITEDSYSIFLNKLSNYNCISSVKNFLYKNKLINFYNYILEFINSYTYIIHIGFFNSKIYFESAKRDLYFKLNFIFHDSINKFFNLNLRSYDSIYPECGDLEILDYLFEVINTSISKIYNIYG